MLGLKESSGHGSVSQVNGDLRFGTHHLGQGQPQEKSNDICSVSVPGESCLGPPVISVSSIDKINF